MPMKSFLTFMQILGFALVSTFAFAQSKEISGTVKSADTGGPLPGATVVVEGTTNGTATDVNGKYTLQVNVGDVIVFSFIGMQDEKRTVGQANIYDVTLEPGVIMDEFVVTALGISREKKSLGYATQEISGEAISTIKSGNVVNQISGKAAGVKVRTNNNLGGSTDIIIRGYSSLTGSNQPLFVVDGVPLDNSIINSDASRGSTSGTGQTTGRKGFDYGNGIADINPADIASMNILKGGAATALYGSRAANGVVIITTKKGTSSGKKGIGVEINSSATIGFIDKSTFIDYQEEYGAGYGPGYSDEFPYFFSYDVNGDTILDRVTPLTEDASYGARFDPNLMVYHYDAFVPESDYYRKPRPWVYPEHGPVEFFNNSLTLSNNFALTGANEMGGFRMSYSNTDISGIMPNASQVRNNFSMNGSYNFTEKLQASGSANFINTRTLGRNSTGYSDNIGSMFRQWWQTNVDILRQKELFEETGRNITWNPSDIGDETPIFWDNPYWSRYKNYQNDERNRFYGFLKLNYNFTDKLSLNGMASIDTYTDLQEERRAIGSVPAEFGIGRPDVGSGYARLNRNYKSMEYRLILNYNTDLSEDLNLNLLGGTSFRFDYLNTIYASTNGGLVVPELYAISNSVNNPLASPEREESEAVYGYFANASLGIKNTIYVDVTGRVDQSSTLPTDNNTYFYPGVSASYLFADVIDADWLNFAKLRLGWAQVGNAASFAQLTDVYTAAPSTFGNVTMYSVASTKRNAELRPEISTTIEGGLNFIMFDRRLELDVALYKTNTIDQVVPVAVSYATGNSFKVINAGEILNQGVEIAATGVPVKTDNFQWRVNVNWAKNNSEVIKLAEGLKNLQLGSFQGGVSINATEGEPYGTIQGTDYVYLNGERVVRPETFNDEGERQASSGAYAISPTTNNILGNIIPDWIGGITNTFLFGDFSVSFLVDFSMGGEIFSLDRYYGLSTGLPKESVGTNDLGNPIRNTLDNGGGVILEGVTPDGDVNQVRLDMSEFGGYGYVWNPAAGFVYDASWIKLREFSITYKLPKTMLENTFLAAASVSLIGSNVWIIHKNLPDADPEATISSGNLQGWQSGMLPTTRNFGLSVNLQF